MARVRLMIRTQEGAFLLSPDERRESWEVTVSGAPLQECLADLLERNPLLRTHLYEEVGQLRRHVLILYNDQNTRWLDGLDVPVRSGDRITVLQVVSGAAACLAGPATKDY